VSSKKVHCFFVSTRLLDMAHGVQELARDYWLIGNRYWHTI